LPYKPNEHQKIIATIIEKMPPISVLKVYGLPFSLVTHLPK